MVSRIVSQFSCGAASAVATKMTITQHGQIIILNAFIEKEHEDNKRFLADCERWFGCSITVVMDEKYNASPYEVWQKKRFMKSRFGAPCSQALKRKPLDAASLPGDTFVLGFTYEERDRADRWIDANNGRKVLLPLIEAGLKKSDCLAIIERAGIALPAMYLLGYHNNNCIGCCKGGEGYWNKIRNDFPERFYQIAAIQDEIGPGSYLFRDRKTGVRVSLRDLPVSAGHYPSEPDISCGFLCELAEREMEEPIAEAEVIPVAEFQGDLWAR